MKVLVIEDSVVIQNILKDILNNGTFEISVANNGEEAIDILKKNSEEYDLLLLDWNMPVMNGETFLQKNLDLKLTDGKIVMMTSESKPHYIMKAFSLGISEYIMKPFSKDVLKTKLEIIFPDTEIMI